MSVEDFDIKSQNNWYMPIEYRDMDIAKFILEQCTKDYELQRVAEELLLYQDKNLFPLLCYCKYLVDTMRRHNIVWGVGRGSSVSSYVLFLIGIHKIDSIFYDLSIDEFLR
jgi:DNA polymerase III alpha subunit